MARGVSNRRNARQGVTKVVTNVRITICDSHNSLPDPAGGLVLEEVFFFIWVCLFIDLGLSFLSGSIFGVGDVSD